jgi:ATP-dependent helicase/nuclease subunit B
MGANQAVEIDAWLRNGGTVVTASDRAARAIGAAYHRSRLAEGHSAWVAPRILDWQSFARGEWQQRDPEGRLVLNPLQERAIWAEIVSTGGHAAATLPESRHRLATMAMEAHALLCSYAPRLLDQRARSGWADDAAAFHQWLAAFDDACNAAQAVSANRMPLELIVSLGSDRATRGPLLLAGFDRLIPVQQALFEAWGNWRRPETGVEPGTMRFYAARDSESELAGCALWCGSQLAAKPSSRLLVLTQDSAKRRGEIERAFLEHCCAGAAPRFEFSLGVPLGGVAIARAALLLLRWLDGALEEHLLDWLFGTGHSTVTAPEGAVLQARMREVRRRGSQRMQWTLHAFLQQRVKAMLPPAWEQRMTAAQHRLAIQSQPNRAPLEWAELVPVLLEEMGWPGPTLGSSDEFQTAERLQKVVGQCGSLGFDGRRIPWREFLGELDRALAETLFSPESQDAPILIAGPAESAGLAADAIWFLGASEDEWPRRGNLNPLLPSAVQREARIPHASPQLDWDLANAITARLSVTAPVVCFSFAQQVEGVDVRRSRIVAQLAGSPEALPLELRASTAPLPITISGEDQCLIPLKPVDQEIDASDSKQTGRPQTIRGGSSILTAQSHCPFKAFATERLGAKDWDPAEAGLSAAQRGQLLHAVMHSIWAGPPDGLLSLDELIRLTDRRAFVADHVNSVMTHELPDAARELMPQRYLQLEAERLIRLVSEWLDYEAARLPFTVVGTELNTKAAIADLLTLDLRLDRIDQLNDGSLLVIDYKTGDVSEKSWDLPRPEDLQLPLYGGFALEPGQVLGGLVFAKVRAGDQCFIGRIGDAGAALGYGLKNSASLRRNRLEAEQLMGWRDAIEQLARDYIAGRADVDPRDPLETCRRCGLQPLCRIHERPVDGQDDNDGEADE